MQRSSLRRLTPARQFSLALLLVLLISASVMAATAAWLVQRTVLGQTWTETVHGADIHFAAVFGSDVFVQPDPAAEHAGHQGQPAAGGPGGYGAVATSQTGAPTPQLIDLVRFDRIVRGHFVVYDIVHARFYRTDGRIVYSYEPREVGRTIAELTGSAGVAQALRGQEVVEGGSLLAGLVPEGQARPEVLSFFMPVKREGQVVGGAWLQRDVAGLMGAIRQAQAVIVGACVAGATLLFFTLRRVYADSTDTIQTQASALVAAYGELRGTYDATLQALVTALDNRDTETGGHAQRVTGLALRLGRELGLGEAEVTVLQRGAVLHDIGKIGVPDAILRKPGPLTEAEWAVMRQHPTFGAAILAGVPFLAEALPVVRHHHERWDGSGYPDGLAGEAIPMTARIFAVADSFDAMTSRRPYRQPFTLQQARDELARCAGTQFDPAVVAACAHLRCGDADFHGSAGAGRAGDRGSPGGGGLTPRVLPRPYRR